MLTFRSMRCVDVNVLVYAHRADLPAHEAYRDVLNTLANDDEPLGLADVVLSGLVRVVTNRRIFTAPMSASDAWDRVDELLAAPAAVLLHPGRRHWEVFRRLTEQIDARGNDVTDAYLAAYAVENSATWLSADRGFARFRDVRWEHPLGR
jgi:toxin-antitoxin system PIN domain toxin